MQLVISTVTWGEAFDESLSIESQEQEKCLSYSLKKSSLTGNFLKFIPDYYTVEALKNVNLF